MVTASQKAAIFRECHGFSSRCNSLFLRNVKHNISFCLARVITHRDYRLGIKCKPILQGKKHPSDSMEAKQETSPENVRDVTGRGQPVPSQDPRPAIHSLPQIACERISSYSLLPDAAEICTFENSRLNWKLMKHILWFMC